MTIWVKVVDDVTEHLSKATGWTEEMATRVLAESALHHAAFVMGAVPEAVKGKITVDVTPTGQTAFVVRYQTKAGAEANTITHQTVFIPESKFGTTTKSPVVSPSGESGYYLSGLKLTGRQSIESFVTKSIEAKLPEANESTMEYLTMKVNQELKIWFEEHGIKFNPALGRYQAPAGGVTLPYGITVPGGQAIAGEF